ncbi:MAG: hypothetical protein IH995_09030 [Proteobacteria bacterium]|nr:hypothetical protein [Pseudomonadota bacterium]
MKKGIIIVDASLDLGQLQRRVWQGEGIIGPLVEIGKQGSDTKLVFNGMEDPPDFKAKLATKTNDPYKNKPSFKLVTKGDCFVSSKEELVLAYRFKI